MPTDLDFGMYFNIAFLSVLGLGILFGFIKGFKKSLWSFLVTVIFIAFFFLTIDRVVNVLWTINMPFLGGLLANVSSDLSGVSTLSDALPILLGQYLPEEFAATATNANLIEFTTSIALFAVKIVYTILYFTVIQILYRLILWILRMIIVPSKKKTDKYKSKNRLLGSVFGLLQGGITVYITLIVFGGIISIATSVASIVPDANPTPVRHIEYREEFRQPTTSIIQMAAIALPDVGNLDDAMEMLEGMIEGYETNILVKYQNTITITDPYDSEGEIPLNLYLFDSVLSMNYQDEQIAFRAELDVLTQVASNVIDSDFMESGDYGDITGTEVRAIFTDLGKSRLITTIIPLAVEVASEAFEVELELPLDELYAIEWDTEIMQLGEVAATALDIVNAAGVFNGSFELDTITLDGDDVEELFVSLGQSELVTLAAYVAIEPILEIAGEGVSGFITVPADLDWATEFAAIGALAGEVLNSGLTVGAVNSGDIGAILPILANIDFTILLDSKIITNAMINILSGETSIDVSEFITIPDGIQWLNLEVDGETVYGELYNILMAINALAESASGLDFDDIQNLNLNTIAQFTEDDINALFESKILVATISNYISDLSLGDDFPIIMPDSVFDSDGYLLKTELQNIVGAVFMLVNELACPIGDDACLELGVNVDAIFTLDGDDIDTLLLSDVLAASAGSLIVDLGGDMLTVPGSALSVILVETVETDVVSSAEIKAAFLAISALGITGIDNLEIDPSILTNLALEGQPTVLDPAKATKLFGSKILNATLSKYLFDFASGAESFITVPYFAENGTTEIRITDPVDGTEYISEDELTNVLEAVLILDIQDFEAIDNLDIGSILSNVTSMLDSSILHATVSKLLLDLTDVVVVPLNDANGDPLKITVGTGVQESQYIAKLELEHVFDALSVLEIDDISEVAIDLTILEELAVEGQPTILDDAKATRLFSSSIINATLAKYLIDFTEGDDALVVVPYFDDNLIDPTAIRFTDAADGTEYINEDELKNILKAVLILDITDFENIENISIDDILSNVSVLTNSKILHATISKQLIDLDTVIVVPTSNEFGDPVRIVSGPVGKKTTYIEELELEAVFDALKVLEIDDINNVAMDMTIINRLAMDDDVKALDMEKADKLFSSAVINATLSKYILDFAAGDDPFLVVPDKNQDGTIDITVTDPVDSVTIIKEAELTFILKAVLLLDLQSFDSVESLELNTILDNVSAFLDSSIMHASISKQFLDLGEGIVVVPTHYQNDDELIFIQGTVEFIDRTELENTFAALKELGINDIANMSVDITQILNNLGEELDPTVLDNSKANTLFSSTILKATIAKYILDFSEGATPILQVPQINEANVYIKTQNSFDTTVFIIQDELTNVLSAILALGLSDFDNVSTLSLETIIANKTAILDSAILQATVSQQLIDLAGGTVIIPEFEDDNSTEVLVTKGEVGQEMTFIARLELDALLDALEVLDIGNLDSFDGGVDLSVLDEPGAVHTLVQSAILQATISDQVLDLAGGTGDTLVIIPYQSPDGLLQLRRTIGVTEQVQMIEQLELEHLIDAFVALGFTDVDNLELAISISTLTDNAATIFESYTLQATVSKQVLDLESATVIIPYYADNDITRLRNISGDVLAGEEITEFIDKDELIALMAALNVLLPDEGENVGSFSGDVDISLFYEVGPRTTLLSSSILQATISKQIIDLGSSAIEVPEFRQDTTTVVKLTAGNGLEATDYLVTDEIHALFEALQILGMNDLDQFDGSNLTFDIFLPSYGVGYEDNQDILLASACIQATVSTQIIDLGASITVPTHDAINDVIKVTLVSGIEFIVVSEIKHMFNALDVLGFSITDFDGSLGLSALFESQNALYDTNQDVLLASAIMHATVSGQIEDLDGSAIIIPTANRLSVETLVDQSGNEFIIKTEIKALLNGMDKLGFSGDLSGFGGAIDLDNLSDPLDQDIILASAILHATMSDQISDLGGTALIIPSTDILDSTVYLTTLDGDYFIEKTEIKALLAAMDVLGIGGDLTTFGGSIGLSSLMSNGGLNPDYQTNQVLVLSSAIMHRTITNQIVDLGATTLVVPDTDIDSFAIDETVSTNFFITKAEIQHLFDAMDILGVNGDLSTFDGAINLTAIKDDGSQNTLLLSAIMHATLSDKLIDTTLIIPDKDIDRASVDIRVTLSGTEFIEGTEIKALLVALDLLGLTSFGSMGLDIQDIYAQDMTVLLASATIQATMSDEILPSAKTYAAAASGEFIIPGGVRESITVETVAGQWIEQSELIKLVDAFEEMGLLGFNVTINATVFSTYDRTKIHAILESGSMHMTMEKMIMANANVNTFIPDIDGEAVIVDTQYGLTNVIHRDEVENFIVAINQLGGDVGGNFNSGDLSVLTDAEKLEVITSAIARCKLTPEFVAAKALLAETFAPTDFEILSAGVVAPECLTLDAAKTWLGLV